MGRIEQAGRTVVVETGGMHGHVRALGDGDGALLAGGVGGRERRVLRALLRDGDHRREQPQRLVEHAVNAGVESTIRAPVSGRRDK